MNDGQGRGGALWWAELPRRIPPRVPGVRMVSWGSLPEQVASARHWCRNGTRLSYDRAYPLIAILTELHTNALRHSASGQPCGRVRMEMAESQGSFRIAVTDDGARAGAPHSVPEVGDGFGLRLVERLATDWGWSGTPGHPLTVWAVVDPRAPLGSDEAGPAPVPNRAPAPGGRAPEVPAQRSAG
ncbi:ATP-binding protein [Nocardiopsis sp. NPDC058631]|uniref:ATP-binding protein n=1 Tax=Nocardiopsis sp. NPDC058631 TaxID=3346566 RepID=UPI00366808CC